jgi:TRAP-type uncharacterized transport system fused permease subunit
MASLTAPILVTVGRRFGMEIPLIGAHLFCFYFGILADDTPPVGLASYAAAALAESKPIPTGIQGFLYDLRTTIIPFMFIFNTKLILHGVHSWHEGVFVFLTAAAAACIFTSAIQGWFLRKNRWYEALLLLASAIMLFNPSILSAAAPGSLAAWWGYATAIGLISCVIILQRVKPRTP